MSGGGKQRSKPFTYSSTHIRRVYRSTSCLILLGHPCLVHMHGLSLGRTKVDIALDIQCAHGPLTRSSPNLRCFYCQALTAVNLRPTHEVKKLRLGLLRLLDTFFFCALLPVSSSSSLTDVPPRPRKNLNFSHLPRVLVLAMVFVLPTETVGSTRVFFTPKKPHPRHPRHPRRAAGETPSVDVEVLALVLVRSEGRHVTLRSMSIAPIFVAIGAAIAYSDKSTKRKEARQNSCECTTNTTGVRIA